MSGTIKDVTAIQSKRLIATGKPKASDVQEGELVPNLADKTLYTKDHVGNIIELGGSSSVGIKSDVTQAGGGTAVDNIVKITQAAYTALATKDATTIYIIVG